MIASLRSSRSFFYYIKNQVCIDVEIAMGYMVADTHNLFPGNFASDRK